jgi:HlyD family type I secretion membrane fusion protein
MSYATETQWSLADVGVKSPLLVAGFVTIVFLGGGLAWGAFAPLESAAMASGVLVVDSSRKTVAHLEGGIVGEINVREGDQVTAGQVLIRLDRTVPQASLDLLRGQLYASLGAQARLAAVRDWTDTIQFPTALTQHQDDPLVQQVIATEQRTFKSQHDQLDSQTQILLQRNSQLDEQIRGINAQIQAEDRELELMGEEIEGSLFLFKKGLEPKPRLLALQRQQADIEGARGANVAKIAEAEQQIGEGKLRIIDLRAQMLTDAMQKLRDEQTKMYETSDRIRGAEDTLRRTDILAPTSGRVVGLKVFTVGGIIAPHDPLMDIVPDHDVLVVDAQLAVTDVDVVYPGLPVQLRFTALNQRTTPNVEGTVLNVGADRMVDQHTGQPYYNVRINVGSTDELPKDTKLQPGMPVEAMIRTGSRTFLRYLAKPILDFIGRGLHEG